MACNKMAEDGGTSPMESAHHYAGKYLQEIIESLYLNHQNNNITIL
jgi:hypothetical protein